MNAGEFYTPGNISSYFGDNPNYAGHSGVDVAPRSALGQRIPSPGIGLVHHAGTTAAHGNYISVQFHEWFLKFCHQPSRPSTRGWVSLDADLGTIGMTGLTDGPHVHIEMSMDPVPGPHAQRHNPWPFILELMAEGQPRAAALEVRNLQKAAEDMTRPTLLKFNDGDFAGIGFILSAAGVTASQGPSPADGLVNDGSLLDIWPGGEEIDGKSYRPYDLTTRANFLAAASVLGINEQDIADAVWTKGTTFPKRTP